MSRFGDLMQNFIMSNPKRASWFLSKAPTWLLEKLGRKNALTVFREAAQKIPAYQDFLYHHGVNPEKIKNLEEVSLTDKENYLRTYSFKDLCLEPLGKMDIIYRSSGNSGIPFWWPQLSSKDKAIPRYFELYYRYLLDLDNYSTLVINVLDMGVWIAGITVATNLKQVALTGKYQLSVISPGSDIQSALEIIEKLGKLYDQILIIGYPPFLENLVAEGEKVGINWQGMRVRIQTGGEPFSETWREKLRGKLGVAENDLLAVTGVFGSSDTGSGMAGFETPLTILVKRLATQNKKLCTELFGGVQLPTLVQFVPMSYFIEEIDGEILLTSKSGIPLIRYNIHDRGGVVSFDKMLETLHFHGYDVILLLSQMGYRTIWRLPFFYCFGRKDAISIDGANIYAEDIGTAIAEARIEEINDYKLTIRSDEGQNIRFTILVELKEGVKLKDGMVKFYHDLFLRKLLELSFDFNNAYKNNPQSCDPLIKIYRFSQGPFAEEEERIKQKHIL